MKIKSVKPITVHIVETDEDGYTRYTRYSDEVWTVSIGESDEAFYNCAELEAAFKAFIANNQKENNNNQ